MVLPPRLFSFFSGAGLLDLGFEVSGFGVDFVNEIHEPFLKAYQYARSSMGIPPTTYDAYSGSIEDLLTGREKQRLSALLSETRKQSDVIGFIGGPPCPDFSIGGRNRGRHGRNGRLSASYVEVICQQKPDFFLFENVKGLWQTLKHRQFFEELKLKLHKAGYVTIQRLINAIEYGAPQDRDRIVLVGFRQGFLADMGMPSKAVIDEDAFPWEQCIKHSKDRVLSLPWPSVTPFEADSILDCPDGIEPELTVEHWFERNRVLSHPNAKHHFKPRAARIRFETIDEGDVSRSLSE